MGKFPILNRPWLGAAVQYRESPQVIRNILHGGIDVWISPTQNCPAWE
jgi:hypothetical protein